MPGQVIVNAEQHIKSTSALGNDIDELARDVVSSSPVEKLI